MVEIVFTNNFAGHTVGEVVSFEKATADYYINLAVARLKDVPCGCKGCGGCKD